MHSIRTNISTLGENIFRSFLKDNDMEDVFVGSYEFKDNLIVSRFLCYAYSDRDGDTVANMTYMILKHGSVEAALYEYIEKPRPRRPGDSYTSLVL